MKKIIVIAGPTAVGKTRCAIELAERLDTEIVSADSMQVYRHLEIGTAKPTPSERARIRHHMVDVADPLENSFSVAVYKEQAEEAIRRLHDAGKIPIVAGGTGLYINAILYRMDFSATRGDAAYRSDLERKARIHGNRHLHALLEERDPEAAGRIHPNNLKRVIRALEIHHATGSGIGDFARDLNPQSLYDPLIFCLHRERSLLYDRINSRVDAMMAEGLLDEVRRLVRMGLTQDHLAMKGIGYKECLAHLEGRLGYEDMVKAIKRNSRRYAKRQLTWFRRYEQARWIEVTESLEADLNRFWKETEAFLSCNDHY